jgi:hypothetical protein
MSKIEASKIIDIYNDLDSEKGTLKSHLQEIADYMLPRRQGVYAPMTPGGKRMTKIYDGTAIRALRIFANGLYGHLTSPAYPWFEITTKDKALVENQAVKFWLSGTTERMRAAINSSNAPLALHETYTNLGWAGTGCIYIEKGKKRLLNFMSFNIANVCITVDAEGNVDGVYRLDRFTARQCIQKWQNKCSDKIKKAYKANKKDKFDIIHAVYPRDDYDWRKMDAVNMPFAVRYIEKDTKQELEEGGHKEFPYMVPRWEKDDDEDYGRSCGMDALPDTKMLNQQRYDDIRATQKRIDPPLTASTEAALSTTRTSPGSVIYHRKGEKPEVLELGGDIQLAFESENQTRDQINRAFYADLFLMLAQNNDPNKTATEVRELIEEKLTLLGPALGRLQTELFDPMLSRCFWVLYRNKMIAPVPQELMGQGLEVEYIGRLALAMKQTETRATASTIQFIEGISTAKQDPRIWDNFNDDEIALGTAQRSGMPIKYLNTPEARDVIRQARDKAAADAKQTEDLALAAKSMPGLTKAPETGSPAEAMSKTWVNSNQQH